MKETVKWKKENTFATVIVLLEVSWKNKSEQISQ